MSALAPAQEDLKEFKEVVQAGENPNQQKMLEKFQLARFSVIQGDSLKRLKSRVFPIGSKRANLQPTARKLYSEKLLGINFQLCSTFQMSCNFS